jgi:hypothetical protein
MTSPEEQGPLTFPKYDADPEALAWARGRVEAFIERLERFKAQAEGRGDEELAKRWRMTAWLVEREFIGGEGCVIAAFDERRPKLVADLEKHGQAKRQ